MTFAGADRVAGVTDEDVLFAGAVRQAEMIRAGEVSPTELLDAHLDRIERLEPRINAFRVVLAERARAEAQQAEARLKEGEERPLLGVPIALKDSVDLAGEITTHGTDAFDEPARADSEMTRRLRAAGAVIVGKTNLPELAICGFTESATWGVTRNPWDPQRTSGGSSGGSAAAVAAGMVPLASASDGAGSIRIPAASCGIFGLKPQRGRIPLDPDHFAVAPDFEEWNGMSVNGCEARTVLDSAIYLDITLGGSREPGAPPPPERPFAEAAQTPPGKLRIATSVKPPRAILPPDLHDDVVGAVREASELLRGLGHEVAERDPDYGRVGDNMSARYLRGVADDVRRVPHPERLERRTRGFGRLGGMVTDGLLAKAKAGIETDGRRIGAIFEDFDVLVTPVMCGTALPVRRFEGMGALRTTMGQVRFYPFTGIWNHLGNPAAAVPMGFAPDGLPLSVMLVGRPADEATLFSLSAQIEAERPWAGSRPPL